MWEFVTSWISAHGGSALDIGLGVVAIQLSMSLKRVLESQVKMNESQDVLLKTLVATQANHEGRIDALEGAIKTPVGFQYN